MSFSGLGPLTLLLPTTDTTNLDTTLKPISHPICLILSQCLEQTELLPTTSPTSATTPTYSVLSQSISLWSKFNPSTYAPNPSLSSVLCFIINQPLQQLQSLPTGPFSSAYKPVQVSIKTKPSSHSTSDNHCPSISSYPTPFPHPLSPFHCLLLSPPFP